MFTKKLFLEGTRFKSYSLAIRPLTSSHFLKQQMFQNLWGTSPITQSTHWTLMVRATSALMVILKLQLIAGFGTIFLLISTIMLMLIMTRMGMFQFRQVRLAFWWKNSDNCNTDEDDFMMEADFKNNLDSTPLQLSSTISRKWSRCSFWHRNNPNNMVWGDIRKVPRKR